MNEDVLFGKDVIRQEAQTLASLADRLAESFARAVELILSRPGKVVVSGVGKAGLIGRKIAATFSSTGTPSVFMHPTDAHHGDLGVVLASDAALLLSNSGQTAEMVSLVHHLRNIGAKIIVVSGNEKGPLCRSDACDVFINIGTIQEACPLGLAPSCSTTAMLALGDALALTVLKRRGFTGEDYARFHPAGDLGRRLLKVKELMRTGERLPLARPDMPVGEVIGAITKARAGGAPVVDDSGRLLGIFTDGDFRRLWTGAARNAESAEAATGKVMMTPVGDVMTAPCLSIGQNRPIGEAMGTFRKRHVNELPVLDREGRVVGLLDVQDIIGIDI